VSLLGGLIVSALKSALTVTRFGKRLVLRAKSHEREFAAGPAGNGNLAGELG
jgi:hypothetical protein